MAFCALSCSLVLLGICMLGTSDQAAVCKCTEKSRECGSLDYDATKYTCCSGNIIEGYNLTCCGTTVYNILESSCCKNKVTFGLSQTVSYCCGSEAYNPLNQICCNGHVQNKPTAQTDCCGSKLFDKKEQLCCKIKYVVKKTTTNDVCCGDKPFNPETHCCSIDLTVKNISDPQCYEHPITEMTLTNPAVSDAEQNKKTKCSLDEPISPKEASVHHESSHYCGSKEVDLHTQICCSGVVKNKGASLTQCCGKESYELSEDGVLCCDGKLYRNQPNDSVCSGTAVFSPKRYTVCQRHAHLPAGQQCCGKRTFNPSNEICCNGHKHQKSGNAMVCCGSFPYVPEAGTHKCCSGHLHELKNKRNVECCGPLLLTSSTNQHCCHSAEKTVVYKSLADHYCCGHLYYKKSLWSCCADRLIPTPTDPSKKQEEEKFIRPLMDYNISAICNEPVLLGTVESVAMKSEGRFVSLRNVLKVNKTVEPWRDCPSEIPLKDHCLFPALELGRTYLWTIKYEPFAVITDLISAVHTILSLCQRNQTKSVT